MSKFKLKMRDFQIEWRKNNPISQVPGKQNKQFYDHVLHMPMWQDNLFPQIAGDSLNSLPTYLKDSNITKHTGSHNLLSSWIVCANLYFPFRDELGRQLLSGFLQEYVSDEIIEVTNVELEHAFNDPLLTPKTILGEDDGLRGSGQTSPDVAFEVKTKQGNGIVLVECKFTEHNFYPCSGRKKNAGGKLPNPDMKRCDDAVGVLENPSEQCHLYKWGRKYWDYLAPIADIKIFMNMNKCPAATAGYQLFRQQALAEGIKETGKLAFSFSAVAYDARNLGLMRCLSRSTSINNIKTDWEKVFRGKAGFAVFTHQDWVNWVNADTSSYQYIDWLNYVKGRYQF